MSSPSDCLLLSGFVSRNHTFLAPAHKRASARFRKRAVNLTSADLYIWMLLATRQSKLIYDCMSLQSDNVKCGLAILDGDSSA